MTDFFKTFLEAMKDGKKVFGSLFIFTLIFLIMPDQLKEALHCKDLPKVFYTTAGVICILSFSVLLVFFLDFLKKKYQNQVTNINRSKYLKELTVAEKSVLKKYVLEGKTSVSGEVIDGVIGGLYGKQIIFRSTQMSGMSEYFEPTFQYNIHPWALRYLKKHPKLLD